MSHVILEAVSHVTHEDVCQVIIFIQVLLQKINP